MISARVQNHGNFSDFQALSTALLYHDHTRNLNTVFKPQTHQTAGKTLKKMRGSQSRRFHDLNIRTGPFYLFQKDREKFLCLLPLATALSYRSQYSSVWSLR